MTISAMWLILRRRWRVIAMTVLICGGGSLLAGQAMSTTYTASASLVVSPLGADPFGSGGTDVNIQTEREVIGSREVARRAAETLGMELDPDSHLLAQSKVAAPSGSQVLIVSVSAASPHAAAEAANALASAYLDFRSEQAATAAEHYITEIDTRLTELVSGTDPDTAGAALVTSLQDQRHRLSLMGTDAGSIIGHAEPPQSPSSPGTTTFLAAGVVGGLLAGVFLALLRERTDRRLRSADRLAESSGHDVVTGAWADTECWRLIAFQLRQQLSEDEEESQIIGVLGPDRRTATHALTSLADALSETEDPVRVPDPSAMPGSTHGHDGALTIEAPERARITSALRLADLTDLGSQARVAAACEQAAALVLVVTPRTTLREVDDVLDAARMAGLTRIRQVFLTSEAPDSAVTWDIDPAESQQEES